VKSAPFQICIALTGLPPVIKARNLKSVANPLKRLVIAVLANEKNVPQTTWCATGHVSEVYIKNLLINADSSYEHARTPRNHIALNIWAVSLHNGLLSRPIVETVF